MMNSRVCTSRIHFAAIGSLVSVFATACGDDPAASTSKMGTQSIAAVSINEVMTKNSTFKSDTGKKSDWLEFYNSDDVAVSLEGYAISDNKDALLKARLPAEAVVPAKGFLVIWLDGTTDLSTPLHFPFKLSGDGDNFYISTPEAKIVQKLSIPADPTGTDTTAPDVSYGAYPDGASIMGWCATPTPNNPNAADCSPPSDAGI